MKQPFIIAEIAQGYEGSEKLVDLYVKAAAKSGADAIKFQIFYADELALPDYMYYDLFKELEIPFKVWERAVKQSHEMGMEFYSDVLGVESFLKLQEICIDGYKIHTTDINNINLLKVVANSGKKVFLSTGGCQLDEIRNALEILKKCEVILMYGFQAEPTESIDNNLSRIGTLGSLFQRPVGFQDHTKGAGRLAFYIAFIAMGEGAYIMEKHLTLSRIAEIEDSISALIPEEFIKWAKILRQGYLTIGTNEWEPTEKEISYRCKVRRSVCSFRDIAKGEVIKESDVILKRTNVQDTFFDISEVVGMHAKADIRKNTVLGKEIIG